MHFELFGVYENIIDFSIDYLSRLGLTIFPQDYVSVGANLVNNGYYKVVYSEQLLYFYKNGFSTVADSPKRFVEQFLTINQINNSLTLETLVKIIEDRELFFFNNLNNQFQITDTCLKSTLQEFSLDINLNQ